MIILLMIGAAAIFIWSQLSPKKPVEKTEALESPLPEARKDIIDVFKENVPKVAAIVGGAGAALATGGGAAVAGGAAAIGSGIAAAVTIPAVALPAARVLPAAVMETAVGTGSGVSSVGAGGASGAGAAVAGAAMVASPLIIMPLIAKALDKIFPKHVVTESEQAAMDAAHTFRQQVADIPGVTLVKGQFGVGD